MSEYAIISILFKLKSF